MESTSLGMQLLGGFESDPLQITSHMKKNHVLLRFCSILTIFLLDFKGIFSNFLWSLKVTIFPKSTLCLQIRVEYAYHASVFTISYLHAERCKKIN